MFYKRDLSHSSLTSLSLSAAELVEVGRGGAGGHTTPLAKQKPKRKQPEDGATPNYSNKRYDEWFWMHDDSEGRGSGTL